MPLKFSNFTSRSQRNKSNLLEIWFDQFKDFGNFYNPVTFEETWSLSN